jgi:hypothetical protein
MRTALAAVLALALALVAGAGAVAAPSPIPGTLGLALTPAPIHVDDGVRTITAVNRSGGLALAVTLTPSAGYAVEPSTFTLAPDAEQAVTVTAVNPSADGTLEALATSNAPGAVKSAIALSTRFIHETWLERNPAVVPFGLLLAAGALLAGLWAVRRRLRA